MVVQRVVSWVAQMAAMWAVKKAADWVECLVGPKVVSLAATMVL